MSKRNKQIDKDTTLKLNNASKLIVNLALTSVLSSFAAIAFAQESEFAPGQIVTGFQRGQEREARAALRQLGYRELQYNETLNASLIGLPENLDPRSAAERLRSNRSFAYAEPNFMARAMAVPADPLFANQWGPWYVGAPCAWNLQIGSPAMRIAIIDTGVDFVHPDLGGKILNNGWDFVNNDPLPADDHGHGTHCAGIAAGMPNNNAGIAGMDWNARILPIKVLNAWGSGTYWNVAQGIIYAAHPNQGNANILSLSLSGSAPSSVLQGAVQFAHSASRVIVAAAGNKGTTNRNYPAYYAETIAVGASTYDDSRASFSSYGPWWNGTTWDHWVDVAAPGVNILSSLWTSSGNTWASWSGTSMATPMVAGLAGLVWSQMGPGATPAQVRQRIEATCDPVRGGAWVAFGRVNAHRAVAGSLTGNTSGPIQSFNVAIGTPAGAQNPAPTFALGGPAIVTKSIGGLGNRRVHFTSIRTTAMCPASVKTLTIRLRLRDTTPIGGTRQLFVKNQRTGSFDPIGAPFGVNGMWTVTARAITSFASHYVNPYNGQIEFRLEAKENLVHFKQSVDWIDINCAY